MEALSTDFHTHPHYIIMPSSIPSTLLLITTLSIYNMRCTKSFSVGLIHRDSPNSPYHNPDLPKWARFQASVHRSLTHIKHSKQFPTKKPASLDSKVISNKLEYLMELYIGTPSVKILANIDTTSDLTWIQCQPCHSCYKQSYLIFDPTNSSTYHNVSCSKSNYNCKVFPNGKCSSGSLCQYHVSFSDHSTTNGLVSLENFTFDNKGKNVVLAEGVYFGCSHTTNGTYNEIVGGQVGLGRGQLSLPSQFGSRTVGNKFSYCLGSYMNNSNGWIKFGEDSVVSKAVTLPILDGDNANYYYMSLESISIGADTAKVIKDTTVSRGNIIIDTAIAVTLLDDATMKTLAAMVSKVIEYRRVDDKNKLFDVCFSVKKLTDIESLKLPNVVLEFSGVRLELPPVNVFYEVAEGVVCLAMIGSGKFGGVSVLGNLAQQNLHFGFDLKGKMLSIAPVDCSKLLP